MGSYDVTCSLTSLPIMIGDPCVLVVFKEKFNPREYMNCGDVDYYVDFIMKSTYDDYGRVENMPDSMQEVTQP